MSLEEEAWKLDDLRRRAAGAPPAESVPASGRGSLGWTALVVLVGLLSIVMAVALEGLAWLHRVNPFWASFVVAVAIIVGAVVLLNLSDDVRVLRQRVAELEAALQE